MAPSRHMIAPALLLLLALLAATETERKVAEALPWRLCDSWSPTFEGPCVRSSECDRVCRTEGLDRGKCATPQGQAERKCLYSRICYY